MKRKSKELNIGDIVGDQRIVEKLGKNEAYQNIVRVECIICGRQKIMKENTIYRGSGIQHRACGKGIKNNDARFYRIWQDMRSRTNINNKGYHAINRYAGRGINSDEFANFIDFYDKMYDSYVEHFNKHNGDTTLERIDNNGNYCIVNCKWITQQEQKSNTIKNVWFIAISPTNEMYKSNNQCAFAREHNLNAKQINACLVGRYKTHLGWQFHYEETTKKCND